MEEQISTRIPQWLANELDQVELPNRSKLIRDTLEKELIEATKGVCAITGKRCYINSEEVAMDSPLGESLGIPDDIPFVHLTGEKFSTVAKQQAKGELTDIQADELYINKVGPATYFAENQYLAATKAGEIIHEDSWMSSNSRYVRVKPKVEDDDLTNWLRSVSALEWCYLTDDTPDAVTIQKIWGEQDMDTQNKVIGNAAEYKDMGDGECLLVDIVDKLGVDYDRAVI